VMFCLKQNTRSQPMVSHPINVQKLITDLQSPRIEPVLKFSETQFRSFTTKICVNVKKSFSACMKCTVETFPKNILSRWIAEARACKTLACYQWAELLSETAISGTIFLLIIILTTICYGCSRRCRRGSE